MEHNIIDKLRKMIAHQQSAAAFGSLKEAETFAGRIQQLLSKYKLSMSDIGVQQEEEKAGVSSGLAVDPRRFGMKDKDALIVWLVQLAKVIAEVNDCQIMVQTKSVKTTKAEYKKTGKWSTDQPSNYFIFVGVENDRLVAEEFFVYMAKLTWDLAGKAGDNIKENLRSEIIERIGKCAPGHLSSALHDFRHAYCKGFVQEVSRRLREEREKEKAAAKASHETALMVIDRRAVMVREYINKNANAGSSAEFYKQGKTSIGFAMGALDGRKVALTSKTVETR